MPDSQHMRPCSYCGYDLRGHPRARKCPECGKRQRRQRGVRAERALARETYGVILACLWRMLVVMGSFALIATGLVLGPLYGGTVLYWSLALSPFLFAITTIMRTSPALVAPEDRAKPMSKRIRQGIRIAGLLLIAVGAIAVVLLASGGAKAGAQVPSGIITVLLLAYIVSIVVCMAGVWSSTAFDDWLMDDQARFLHETSMWMIILVGVLFPGILFVLANFSGSFTRPIGVSFIGVIGWWLMVVAGDGYAIYSTVWCLRHRMQYEEIQERQEERDRKGREQVRRRLDAIDRAGER